MPKRLASSKSRSNKNCRFRSKRSTQNTPPNSPRCKEQEALGDQSLAAKQRVDDMVIEATRRRDDQIAELTRSALQQQERDYQAFGASITQAFNSQLRGLLAGTTNWHTAFTNMLQDLLIKFIEWCETTVEHYVLAEAMKTAATTSGVAARTSAEQGGAAASLGAQGAAMVRSILSSAAETFAGVFGFLAPLMGPLAIGPATAAQATVAGMAGAVASADIGMWQVPRDQLALIHQNELIMPAGPAGALRDMLTTAPDGAGAGGGGSVAIHPTTHFHVNAIDSASVASWMRSERLWNGESARPSGSPWRCTGSETAQWSLMTFPTVTGVHLLPSTGEFAYDTISAVGSQRGSSGLNDATVLNFFSSSPGAPTDYTNAISQFQVDHPECKTVSLVIAWFFDSVDASTCHVYPSTNFILGEFEQWSGGAFAPVHWQVSGLTEQDFPGLIPLPSLPGTTNFVYGGTPSDPSVVRCIRDLKSRGFNVVFYPFLLGTGAGFPWRGRITSPGDSPRQRPTMSRPSWVARRSAISYGIPSI